MNNKKRSLLFMLSNLVVKSLAALSHLYAVFVFSKIHAPHETSIIFILLGYAIWFQIFELGVAQTLQNRLNCRKISLTESSAVILLHYLLMLLVAAFTILVPEPQNLLLPFDRYASKTEIGAFSIGVALMIIATNNALIQRILIVSRRETTANSLLFAQSFFSMTSLTLYHMYGEPNLLNSICFYLAPAVLVYIPMIVRLAINLVRRWRYVSAKNLNIISDSVGFWGLNILSSIFLGADYYFAAHYLSSEEIVSYHFSARFFFFSYVTYFAYVQHQAKNLTLASLVKGAAQVKKILKESVFIGLVSVNLVFGCVVVLDRWHIFALATSQRLFVPSLVLAAALYFSFRVLRDVGLVVLLNLGGKAFLYKLYLLEVTLGFALLGFFADEFAGIGIFLAMALVSLVSTSFIFFVLNKLLSEHLRVQ